MIDTVTVTGSVSFPNDVVPSFAAIEFVLRSYDIGTAIVIPKIVRAEVDGSGNFSVDIWPNDIGLNGTTYDVSSVVYTTSLLSKEISRDYLGRIRVLNISGQTLQGLLNAGSYDELPEGSCLLFLDQSGGNDALKVRFANGITKTIATAV